MESRGEVNATQLDSDVLMVKKINVKTTNCREKVDNKQQQLNSNSANVVKVVDSKLKKANDKNPTRKNMIKKFVPNARTKSKKKDKKYRSKDVLAKWGVEFIGNKTCISETLECFYKNFRKIKSSASENRYECVICCKELKHNSLKPHAAAHVGLKPFKCSFCGNIYSRKADAMRHIDNAHFANNNGETSTSSNQNNDEINLLLKQCNICQTKFCRKKSLLMHLKGHINNSLHFVCRLCHIKFRKYNYYLHHMDYFHSKNVDKDYASTTQKKAQKQIDSILIWEREQRESEVNNDENSDEDDELSILEEIVGNDNKEDFEIYNDESFVEDGVVVIKEEPFLEFGLDSDVTLNVDSDLLMQQASSTNNSSRTASENNTCTTENETVVHYNKNISNNNNEPTVVIQRLLTLDELDSLKTEKKDEFEEELIKMATEETASQSLKALTSIQFSLGSNFSAVPEKEYYEAVVSNEDSGESQSKNTLVSSNDALKLSEIHISATIKQQPRKFIIKLPPSFNIDPSSSNGRNTIIKMINYICSGKGKIDGLIGVTVHYTKSKEQS